MYLVLKSFKTKYKSCRSNSNYNYQIKLNALCPFDFREACNVKLFKGLKQL